MAYVDGFVVPVPTDKMDDYKKMARKAGKVWRDHGALQYVECIGDDVPAGKSTSFTRAVKLKEDETVVFAYIVYKSRKHRDEVVKNVMDDPRMKEMRPEDHPFDGKRMIFGGFKTAISLSEKPA